MEAGEVKMNVRKNFLTALAVVSMLFLLCAGNTFAQTQNVNQGAAVTTPSAKPET